MKKRHVNGMNACTELKETKKKESGVNKAPKPAPSGSQRGFITRAFLALLTIAALTELAVIVYMLVVLSIAGAGPHGATVAVGDDIKSMLPIHFKCLQKTMAATGGFYTNTHATEYFEKQKPLFAAAAANFKLHRYFSTLQVPKEIKWHNMIHERIKAFAKLQTEEGRDDYRVEKDRCAMYTFFKNNKLPMCDILGRWHDKEQFVADLKSGTVASRATQWPVFLKACHLTQSSSKGTLIIKSAEEMAKQVEDGTLPQWVDKKWHFRAHDFERPWVKEGDQLTEVLKPGILVQGPFLQPGHSWKVHGRFAVGLLEFRVEVLWGRAYLAQLDGCVLFFRDGVIEDFSTPLAFLKIPVMGSQKLQWIHDEGYMDCVWDLAERAAAATGTESLRIDLFLKQGDPKGCTINENSLSSGMLYWGHDDYLAETWASGHISKKHKMLDTDKPVYELTPDDTGIGK